MIKYVATATIGAAIGAAIMYHVKAEEAKDLQNKIELLKDHAKQLNSKLEETRSSLYDAENRVKTMGEQTVPEADSGKILELEKDLENKTQILENIYDILDDHLDDAMETHVALAMYDEDDAENFKDKFVETIMNVTDVNVSDEMEKYMDEYSDFMDELYEAYAPILAGEDDDDEDDEDDDDGEESPNIINIDVRKNMRKGGDARQRSEDESDDQIIAEAIEVAEGEKLNEESINESGEADTITPQMRQMVKKKPQKKVIREHLTYKIGETVPTNDLSEEMYSNYSRILGTENDRNTIDQMIDRKQNSENLVNVEGIQMTEKQRDAVDVIANAFGGQNEEINNPASSVKSSKEDKLEEAAEASTETGTVSYKEMVDQYLNRFNKCVSNATMRAKMRYVVAEISGMRNGAEYVQKLSAIVDAAESGEDITSSLSSLYVSVQKASA